MSIFTFSAISQNLPNTLPDTGFVGVGTNNPTCNFQVIGQSQISGNLTVDSSLTISDSARIDNNLRVNGHLFVGKNAYITDTTFSNVLRVNRITAKLGDSLVYIGDSSIPFHRTILLRQAPLPILILITEAWVLERPPEGMPFNLWQWGGLVLQTEIILLR
ncbi:MAG: hypothetical protein HUU48_11360 [Flavobacteriales bacterium]|nr:hypothetical protein [Flavobacteriales bacterium]